MKRGLIFLLFLLTSIVQGQNPIGIPDIINYYKSSYNAGTENRSIVEDRNGIMYFANLDGLLSFDGSSWKLYSIPNKTIVRSLAMGKDNRIYAGGQDDFGYFSPDRNGKLFFTSLKSLLSKRDYSFTDIWNIVTMGKDVFFRSKEKIFQYNGYSITVYPAPSEWAFLGLGNNTLIAQDLNSGLMKFNNGLWTNYLDNPPLPSGFIVSSMFSFGNDSSFLTTITSGFYVLYKDKLTPFRFAGFNPLQNQRILTAIPVTRDWIAVGTNMNGCYVVNKKGEVIQNLSRKEGLQINNILSLFLDKDNNLWLGLDDGIDFIAYNNAIKHIYPEKLNEGKGYTSLIYEDALYVGTSNGFYKVPLNGKTDLSFVNGDFIPLSYSKGSSWCLNNINGELLFGYHDGAYTLHSGQQVTLNSSVGFHCFLPLSNVLPSKFVLAGNESGLDVLEWDNKQFISKGNIPGFSEYSQFVAIDNNNTIWVGHPYRGIYKIDPRPGMTAIVRLYTEEQGLPSSVKNQLYKVLNRIVVATEKGIYEYDPKTDRFEQSPYFTAFFGTRNIRYLKEDASGNIWFIEDKNLGVLDFSWKVPKIIYFPELNGKMVGGDENVYPYNNSNILVGSEKGFYHINYESYKKNRYGLDVMIRSVKAFGNSDSLLFGGYFDQINHPLIQPETAVPSISSNMNSIHFEYSAPVYAQQSNVQYSYLLNGFNTSWSDWSKKSEKEYTNLPPGQYEFQIKAKNNLGNESSVKIYKFIVLPPWYQTTLAYITYVLLILGVIYLIFRWQKQIFLEQQQKYEEEQKRLTYLHELELEKSEKEIVKLRNEKLEAEIAFKNTELASTAMHLVQKGELLGNIKEEMSRIKKNTNGHAAPDEFKKIMRILSEENKMDKDWELFAQHFDHVHSDFLSNIKARYPTLSPHELKLCAYLRMNLSSKEIAQLESISVRGVEIGRYRLRKKLKINTETNLFDFLLEISSPEIKVKA
ncbi:MAG TPA: triple tyrosine motif-containing protein [Puia sp.]|jgi:DNA-binding CsgD family transcriptional regulator|nr:triple tyrosine motif-containing protein [Puia sp.]